MTILNREQIDAAERDAEFTDPDVLDTARFGLDLRDAVLDLCDEADRNHEAYLAGVIMDRFIVPSNVTTGTLRTLVARLARGTA